MTTMAPERALLEISMLNAESKERDYTATMADLLNRGLPAEVVTRLREFWEATRTFAGEVIHVGKIVVIKIVEFAQANSGLAIGMAVGAAIGALPELIPWVGSMITPVTMPIGALIGAALGQRMDQGEHVNPVFEGAIQLAKKFFALLATIFNAVWQYRSEA